MVLAVDRMLDGFRGVVTGGAGPLGSALSLALVERGATVVAVDRPGAFGESLPTEPLGVLRKEVDLMSSGDLATFCDGYVESGESLDFVVNNAAFTGDSGLTGYAAPFEQQTDEAFVAALTLNLVAPFSLVRRLLPSLRQSGRGSVVNIASIYGLVAPNLSLYTGTAMGNPAAYAASKGGLVQMSRYLSTVLAPHVRVNAVAPGGIARGQDPAFVQRYEALTPLGRMGRESDVAGLVCFLVGEESSYVTGQCIAVDGGWTAW